MADFLLALADFDRQRAWRDLGYAGLFPFLHRELGLSKAAAFFRMKAAELLRRIPEVVEPLRDGRLCLTSIVELTKVITPENRDAVLPRFFHCSKQEAKAVSAALASTLRLSTVEPPPRPLGTMWSSSGRSLDPQTPRDVTGHWQHPPSRLQTSRLCRAHNDLAARRAYGDHVMDRFTTRSCQ